MPEETALGPLMEIPDGEGKEYVIEHDDEEVEVFVVLKIDDVERETPANRWVQDNQTKKMMVFSK